MKVRRPCLKLRIELPAKLVKSWLGSVDTLHVDPQLYTFNSFEDVSAARARRVDRLVVAMTVQRIRARLEHTQLRSWLGVDERHQAVIVSPRQLVETVPGGLGGESKLRRLFRRPLQVRLSCSSSAVAFS